MPTALDNGSHRLRLTLPDFLRRVLRRDREAVLADKERELRADAEQRSSERPARGKLLERFNVDDEE